MVAYLVAIELIAVRNETAFANRPELENWALPRLGIESEALGWAVVVSLLVVGGSAIVLAVRSRRQVIMAQASMRESSRD